MSNVNIIINAWRKIAQIIFAQIVLIICANLIGFILMEEIFIDPNANSKNVGIMKLVIKDKVNNGASQAYVVKDKTVLTFRQPKQ